MACPKHPETGLILKDGVLQCSVCGLHASTHIKVAAEYHRLRNICEKLLETYDGEHEAIEELREFLKSS